MWDYREGGGDGDDSAAGLGPCWEEEQISEETYVSFHICK